MSSGNVLKSWFANSNSQKSVVIDANKRMVTRMAEYEEQKRKEEEFLKGDHIKEDEDGEEDGFVLGLRAERIETFTDEEGNLQYQAREEDDITKLLEPQPEIEISEEAVSASLNGQPVLQGGMTAEAFQAQREELEKEEQYLEIAKEEYAKLEEELLRRKQEIELSEQTLKEQKEALEAEYAQKMEQFQAECEEMKKTAEEEGFQKGYADGSEKADRELEEAKAALAKKEEELENQYENQIQMLEPKFAETFTGLYRHIFNVDFSKYKDIIPYLIMSTFRKIDGGKNFIIHVSKEDYPYVNLQKKQIQSSTPNNATIEIVEDYTLKETECLIETDGGIFDCGLGTQLDELQKEILVLAYRRG